MAASSSVACPDCDEVSFMFIGMVILLGAIYWLTGGITTGNQALTNLVHAAEDIYKLKDVDIVVTVGDDTTLVAGDILYRFGVPIIGITDGDIDKVVEKGFKNGESLIVELESGYDDIIGQKIFYDLFNGEEIIEIENIESFKNEILQIINDNTACFKIKEN